MHLQTLEGDECQVVVPPKIKRLVWMMMIDIVHTGHGTRRLGDLIRGIWNTAA